MSALETSLRDKELSLRASYLKHRNLTEKEAKIDFRVPVKTRLAAVLRWQGSLFYWRYFTPPSNLRFPWFKPDLISASLAGSVGGHSASLAARRECHIPPYDNSSITLISNSVVSLPFVIGRNCILLCVRVLPLQISRRYNACARHHRYNP
jgi:hypothetical protein